jgi:hypothetical protein
MLRIICVRTGDKYDQWYEDQLRHMIDTYSGLEYDEFEVIKDDVYDDDYATFNKLLMFDRYRDGQNIYFDIDTIIKGDCNKFLSLNLHVCHAWWRKEGDFYKTNPINSSIMSWNGDLSHIHRKIHNNLDWHYVKYYRGIDEYLWENFQPSKYEIGFCSYQTVTEEKDIFDVYLFNQRYQYLKQQGWWSKYHRKDHTTI